jgi:anaerobic selenocysteine-containing dehydrogenase
VTPWLATRFPLILTSSKNTLFCESQHRGLPSLRRKSMDPEVELHPSAAAARGIGPGGWVMIETPTARSIRRAAPFRTAPISAKSVGWSERRWITEAFFTNHCTHNDTRSCERVVRLTTTPLMFLRQKPASSDDTFSPPENV